MNIKKLIFVGFALFVSCRRSTFNPGNNPPGPEYDPRNISRTDSTQSYGPWIAIGYDGSVYVAWMDGGRTRYDPSRTYFRYKPPGEDWRDIEILSDSLHDAWAPHIVVDPFDNVHLVWEANTIGQNDVKIYYRMRTPTGEWTRTVILSGEYQADQPRLAVDSLGIVHLTYCEGFGIKYRRRNINGVWSNVESAPVGRQGAVNPDLRVDRYGGVHLVYEAGNDLKYLYRSPAGEWSEAVNVTHSQYESWYGYIFLDEEDHPWIFWTEQDYRAGWNTGIIYYTHLEYGSWTEPDTIPGTVGWPRHKYVAFHNGELLLAWVDGRSSLNIPVQYIIRRDGRWGAVNEMDFPLWAWTLSGAMGPEGGVHLVWESIIQKDETHYQYDIFYDTIEF